MNRTSLVCDDGMCLGDAVWRPEFVLYSQGHERAALLLIDRVYCTEHQATLTAEDLLTSEVWEKIENAFKGTGLFPPTRARTALNWHRLFSAFGDTSSEPMPY